jgi:hypothetical protein
MQECPFWKISNPPGGYSMTSFYGEKYTQGKKIEGNFKERGNIKENLS